MTINLITDFYNLLISNNTFNLIPIIVQMFILIILNNLSEVENSKFYRILIGTTSLLLTNIINVIFEKREQYKCKKDNSILQHFKTIGNCIILTIIQYAVTYVGPELLYYIPIIGLKLQALDLIPGLNKIIRFGFWIIAFRFANLLTTDETDITASYIFGPLGPFIVSKISQIPVIGTIVKKLNFILFTIPGINVCNGSVGTIRYILLILCIITIIGYEFFLKFENFVEDFEEVILDNTEEYLPNEAYQLLDTTSKIRSKDYEGLAEKGLENFDSPILDDDEERFLEDNY